jgi:hypothetical protein
VAAAICTTNFGANHSVAAVFQKFNGVARLRRVKTWPAAVCIELGFTLEKLGAATSATEGADSVFV